MRVGFWMIRSVILGANGEPNESEVFLRVVVAIAAAAVVVVVAAIAKAAIVILGSQTPQ